jgi:RsiW-degrading membrane proteinase PrsW (M82 family)
LLPVLLFLLSLILLDSFRLVRLKLILRALAAGFLSGAASYLINSAIISVTDLATVTFAVFLAPLVEETSKCIYVGWLIQTRRAGFLIDAAIFGFATGAGFALVENIYYLSNLPNAPLLVWLIRGLGTAVMHGGATAAFAILLKALRPRGGRAWLRAWLPALLAAILIHATFNHFMITPVIATLVMLIVLPLILRLVYSLGEHRLRRWLGRGFDRDTELLALIRDGQVRDTPLGRYLISLRETFRADTVTDMLCLLRLQAELSIRAKGTLLLRENGLEPRPDPELPDKLAEVRHLEHAIGRTGLLALRPVCRWRGSNRWQRHLLEAETQT